MDKTLRKIKMFAIDMSQDDYVSLLGEFNSIEDIIINPSDYSKNTRIEFEEYYIGGDEE
jgi:hypothetical protein